MTASPTNPRPEQGGKPGGPLRGRFRSHLLILLWSHRVLGSLVILLLGVGLYLSLAGVPRGLVDRWIAKLAAEGLHVDVRKMRLDVFSGVVADGVRFYENAERRAPLLEADSVIVGFDPRRWFRKEAGLRAVRVRNAMVCIGPAGGLQDRKTCEALVLERMDGRFTIEKGGVRVHRLRAHVLGMRAKGHGFVEIAAAARETKVSLADVSQALAAMLKGLPRWFRPLMLQLNAMEFEDPPAAEFAFDVKAAEPAQSAASVRIDGGAASVRGVRFDDWRLDARLENGRVEVEGLSARRGDRQCGISGALTLSNRVAEARAYNNLDPAQWVKLMPDDWSRWLKREHFSFGGSGSFELWAGPAPVDQLRDDLAGWVSLQKANVMGIWVEKGFVSVKKTGPRVQLTKVEALLGAGDEQGPLKATGSFETDTGHYTCRLQGGFDPKALNSVWTSNQVEVMKTFVFHDDPPQTEFEITGYLGKPEKFGFFGRASGSNFVFRGVEIASFESPMSYTNGVLDFAALTAVRPEGSVTGRVAIDFDRSLVDIDAVSTAHPHEVARIVGPAADRFMQKYRFEGPAYVAATGRVDFGVYTQTDIRASVNGRGIGIDWLVSEQCSFQMHGLGTRFDFTAITGMVYGGTFEGTASFTDVDQESNTLYDIVAAFNGADFGQLAANWHNRRAEDYEGLLSGSVHVTGVLGEGRSDTATGTGRVSVRRGRLFKIPLLGGLSRLLSMIYPNLGFATQTEFDAEVELANRRASTKNARLEGDILSAVGEGSYRYDGKLDMKVRVHLLRGGAVASVLRLVTFPVSKLLEFHLGGSVDDPKWRPVNLPKEMFLIFD